MKNYNDHEIVNGDEKVNEMKNSRLNIIEEKISEFENISIETM